MKSISVKDFVNLVSEGDAALDSYSLSRNQLSEEVHSKLRSVLRQDRVLDNDFSDFVSMVEQEAYINGLFDGIRLTNNINRLV